MQRARGDVRARLIERCEVARWDLRVEQVPKGTGEGLEETKRIQRERRRRSTEEANEQVEGRKAEGGEKTKQVGRKKSRTKGETGNR